MRRASKDKNHDRLVSVFRGVGCSVAELVSTGLPGWPDTVIGCLGANHLVEIKNPETAYGRAGLNANQTAFAQEWRGERVWTAATDDEALALVQNWRRIAPPAGRFRPLACREPDGRIAVFVGAATQFMSEDAARQMHQQLGEALADRTVPA